MSSQENQFVADSCSSAPDRFAALALKVVLMCGGIGVSAFGYLLTVTARLGNGPLYAIQEGLHLRIGWSRGTCVAVVGILVVGVAALLRAPLGVGTLVTPVALGVCVSALEPFIHVGGVASVRWVAFIFGTAVMMLGSVLIVRASLGVAALDAVMLGLARRASMTPATTRLAMEVGMALLGAFLGGRVGLGTVVMGGTVGMFFGLWDRLLPGRQLAIDADGIRGVQTEEASAYAATARRSSRSNTSW